MLSWFWMSLCILSRLLKDSTQINCRIIIVVMIIILSELNQNGWKGLVTCGGTRKGPACSRRWCAPCWWSLEESPPLRWSFPTGRSAQRKRDPISKQTQSKAPASETLRDAGGSAWDCEAATYVHALPQISHVGFLRLDQLCHDEPARRVNSQTSTQQLLSSITSPTSFSQHLRLVRRTTAEVQPEGVDDQRSQSGNK